MLVIGAQLGILFGAGCHQALPGLTMPNEAFAVVGMAAFFTAVVRAPITGITLIIEMTGSIPMLLPMLFACFTAMLVPTMVGNRPIYESLQEKP
jgi:CIC family chloride channel protein